MTIEIPLNKCPHCDTHTLVYKPLYVEENSTDALRAQFYFGAEEVGRAEDANFFCSQCFRAFWGSGLIEASKEPGKLGLDFKGTVAFGDVGMLVDVDLTNGCEGMTYRLVRKEQ